MCSKFVEGSAQEHEQFTKLISGKLPDGWEKALPAPTPEDKGKATRLHSQDNLNALCAVIDGARSARNKEWGTRARWRRCQCPCLRM